MVVFAKLLTIEHAREHDEVSAFIHSKQFKVREPITFNS